MSRNATLRPAPPRAHCACRYPSNYGTAGCRAYDSTLEANGCADGSGPPARQPLRRTLRSRAFRRLTRPRCSRAQADAPAWCGDEWCYVDKNNCEVAGGAVSPLRL